MIRIKFDFLYKKMINFLQVRHSSQGCTGICSLVGRDLINPQEYTREEITSILWTAMDLKSIMKRRNLKAMDLLFGHNATILMNNPHVNAQIALSNAVRHLGANVNVIVDKNWEKSSDISDLGRCLSKFSGIILAKSECQKSMTQLADGASIPVVSFSSEMYKPLQVLADLLTMQEYFGYLKRLKLGWVGPAKAMFNTYLIMLPKIGMNVKFACTCEPDLPQSPVLFDVAMKSCIKSHTELSECVTPEQAIYRSDVIATTKHDKQNIKITSKLVSEAANKWGFFHDLPRFKTEVSDDVFYSPNSLVWESTANLIWVTMAVVLHLQKDYQPTICKPIFEGKS